MAAIPNVSYTCRYVLPISHEEIGEIQIKNAKQHLAAMQKAHGQNKKALEQCIINLNYALTSLACSEKDIEKAKTMLVEVTARHKNQMPPSHINPLNGCNCRYCCEELELQYLSGDEEDDVDVDVDVDVELIDYKVATVRKTGKNNRTRMTKKDVMTVEEACKCNKASKNHKLGAKKRTDRDSTKMDEARSSSKAHREARFDKQLI